MDHYHYLNEDLQNELRTTAEALVFPGKGILVTDENLPTMGKKLSSVGLENTEENRRSYRQVLFGTAKSMSKFISGVIHHQEALHQRSSGGTQFVKLLHDGGIISGIRVDKGTVPLFGSEDETTTQGLDDLHMRCRDSYRDGCRFAKWRCALKIRNHLPSQLAINENANVLARFASICQQNKMVPVLEPEVLPDGDHELVRTQRVSETMLMALFKALCDHHVYTEGVVLMPNMVLPGQSCKVQYTPYDVAKATLTTLQRTVPAAVPGIAFLSGGQSEEGASVNLDAINKYPGRKPWPLTFSFGRALQASAIKTWSGKDMAVKAAQEVFLKRAKANSEASLGKYMGGVRGVAAKDTLIIKHQEY